MQRYFALNDKLELSKQDMFHISKVMRMKEKDNIEIVFDRKVFLCELNFVSNDSISFNVVKELNVNNELCVDVTIVYSLVVENKVDFILQKCTELGAYSFIPYSAMRSKVKINNKEDKKIERWNMITKEAAEQSYRNICPEVSKVMNLNELCTLDYDLKLVASTKENKNSIKNVLQNVETCDRIIIVVGPEGGLDDKELEILNQNGFKNITFGDTILRTETAPIFAMSAIKYELMR